MTMLYEVVLDGLLVRQKATCQTCRYYLDVKAIHGDGIAAPGECHVNPPRAAAGSWRPWPSVRSDDWCASHYPEETP